MTDPWFKSWARLKGMALQLTKAAGSGVAYHVQVAEHHKKSYYDVKTYENMRSAEDYFYNSPYGAWGLSHYLRRIKWIKT